MEHSSLGPTGRLSEGAGRWLKSTIAVLPGQPEHRLRTFFSIVYEVGETHAL